MTDTLDTSFCPNCGFRLEVVEDTVCVGRDSVEYLLFCENCLYTTLVVKKKEDKCRSRRRGTTRT